VVGQTTPRPYYLNFKTNRSFDSDLAHFSTEFSREGSFDYINLANAISNQIDYHVLKLTLRSIDPPCPAR
jgi:hypothetical protein